RAGVVQGLVQTPMPPAQSPRPGWAEQDAEAWWQLLARTCRALWAADPGGAARIAALSVTTLRSTVVCLDAQGRPLRPAILWLDARRTEAPPPMPLAWRVALTAAGAGGLVGHLRAQAEASWLAAH